MRFNCYLIAAMAAVLGTATAAQAQSTAASDQSMVGPQISGVCMLSRQAVYAHSKVGLAADARLKELATQIRNKIEGEGKALGADIQTYRSQASTLTPADRTTREQALDKRAQAIKAEQDQAGRQLEATRENAMRQISDDAQPVLASAYKSKQCGLLLDRNAVLAGNVSNDLTPAVVQGLDAKITTISFNLAPLPAAGPAGTAN